MVLPVLLRRLGAVVALLGIGCLLVAFVLPLVHLGPNRTFPSTEGALPEDLSVLDLLGRADIPGSPAPRATRILFLLPFLGSCCVVVEALWAWQGSALTRSRLAVLLARLALLLLGMSCALFGLAAIPWLVPVAAYWEAAAPRLASAGPGARLASLGYVVVVAGGVLLAVGALLHCWTLRHTDPRASATTTG